MSEQKAPYTTSAGMSPETVLILADSIAQWMRQITHVMPYYRITEDDWRQICQTAVAMLYDEKADE